MFFGHSIPPQIRKETDMKIVVIGATARIRSETIQRLREDGHEVEPASPRRHASIITEAPRDPGYAGRHVRNFLERSVVALSDLWASLCRHDVGNREYRS
jgi:hypothetical protein